MAALVAATTLAIIWLAVPAWRVGLAVLADGILVVAASLLIIVLLAGVMVVVRPLLAARTGPDGGETEVEPSPRHRGAIGRGADA